MKIFAVLQAFVIATAATAARADFRYSVPDQIKQITPLSGQVDCEVTGYTKRVGSFLYSEYSAQSWNRKKGDRSTDTCVIPNTLILTGDGARAQFIYGWGVGFLRDGNEYSESWVDINCERMESRSTTSTWTYALHRPKQGYDAENMKWQKRYLPDGSMYWMGIGKRAWMPWKVITKISNTERWLCSQYYERK